MNDKNLVNKTKNRIIALDYLRGFFILVIIVDHLWRWPNIFQYVSGRGELWTSAAEGFVIISGLLVGYIRGYKDRSKPLLEVTKKLVKRGIILYIWMIITTLTLVSISWLLTFKGNIAYIPIPTNDWKGLITSVLSFDYVHTLTHFLYLYAIFLFISPLVIWLFRQRLAWIVAVASGFLWWIGLVQDIEWMQWQVLFFIPAIAGFYLEALLTWYRQLGSTTKRIIRLSSIGLTLSTAIISAAIILPTEPATFKNILFSRDPLTLARIAISFVWFVGLISLFQYILPFLERYFSWLLRVLGQNSLTAYIVHIVPLMICQFFLVEVDNFWINSLLALACILVTWSILKIPHINKFIPR
ncbi:MAG: OpgC domain-containing protein [Candidatus Saccharimonadales bacterium]